MPGNANKLTSYTGGIAEVEAACTRLNEADKLAERNKKLALWPLFGGPAIALLGVMTTLGVIAVAGVAVFIGGIIFRVRQGLHDIEDRKLLVARTLLETFRDELAPRKPVTLDMNFRGYWVENERPWLDLKATLQNGMGMHVVVRTLHKRRSQAKRKYTKIKDKIHERVSISFTPPKGGAFDPSASARIKQISPAGLHPKSCKLTEKSATFTFSTDVLVRALGRYGWVEPKEDAWITPPRLVAAVISAFGLLSSSRASGQAAPNV